MKVLIIDDNKVYRQSLNILLQMEWSEARVYEADNGLIGIDQAVKHIPDLILIDGSMPQMNGDEAAAKLRRMPQTQHIPIIAITAEDPETPIWLGLKKQCCYLLPKPFDVPSFLQLVAHTTQNSFVI